MSNLFSTLGRIIIFAGILPGIVGISVYLFLTGNMYTEIQHIVILSILFGFIANSIGHLFDVILLLCHRRKSPLVKVILLKSAKLIDENTENKLMDKIEYLESLRAFYLNSFVIVVAIIIYLVISNYLNFVNKQWFKAAIFLFAACPLFFLSIGINCYIEKIFKEIEDGLKTE